MYSIYLEKFTGKASRFNLNLGVPQALAALYTRSCCHSLYFSIRTRIKLICSNKSASLKWVMWRNPIICVWTGWVCLWSSTGRRTVIKAQLNLCSGSPTQKFWKCDCIVVDLKFAQSFSKTFLKSLQDPATKCILWKIYAESRDLTSEIPIWIIWNVSPFSAMPKKLGQNQYSYIQALYWIKSSFCLAKIPLNSKISACIFSISKISVSYP